MTGDETRRLRTLVRDALSEDVGDGDVTTLWTVPETLAGRARIVAREDGVVSGTAAAVRVFQEVDPAVQATVIAGDGCAVTAGDGVLVVEGPLRGILTAERTALNFLGHLSGVATLSRRYTRAVDGTGCTVVDTRKTTPGWRALEKAATRAGGVRNHRQGLYDMVLVKENHARAAGGVGRALDLALPRAREHGLEVEVEVGDLAQLDQALSRRPDRILLDNMTPGRLREAVVRAREAGAPPPLLEASGGVTLETVRAVAGSGVDMVSVGALTHSAPALDLSLLVDGVESR